jgi:N-methylhydantoinase A/oxoprolinase/acetone carboxylase beta subunit
MGEFERAVTTVSMPSCGPVTQRYIGGCRRGSRTSAAHTVQVMKSSGGVMLPDSVAHQAVSIAIPDQSAASWRAPRRHTLGYDKIITADMAARVSMSA